jgi:hypothetical protein
MGGKQQKQIWQFSRCGPKSRTHGYAQERKDYQQRAHKQKAERSCTICTLLKAFAVAVALAFATIVFSLFGAPAPQSVGVRTLAQHLSLGAIRSRAPPLPA